VKKLAVVLVLACAPGAGSWYDHGDESSASQAFLQPQVLLILGVLLVYAVMASQYESLRDPFFVIFSVPVAGIGVAGGLKLTATTSGLQAYIGVIVLAASTLVTLVLVPSVYPLFEEGFTGSRRQAARQTPERA
jgi:HAE1 family hydrophobic/amphiphilic exporter-1